MSCNLHKQILMEEKKEPPVQNGLTLIWMCLPTGTRKDVVWKESWMLGSRDYQRKNAWIEPLSILVLISD